jgi:homoserine O-succinyltransferase
MTLYLPAGLPAVAELRAEGLPVQAAEGGFLKRFGAAPLKIGLLNLMPDKPATERQIGRMLAASGHTIELSLWLPRGLIGKSTSPDYLRRFYRRIDDLCALDLDALIITGAPVEHLPFEAVTYWDELRRIFDWAAARSVSLLCICWAGQAALRHFHGIDKSMSAEKHFGLLPQQVLSPGHPALAGLGPQIAMPVSRHSTISEDAVIANRRLRLLASSAESGPALVSDEGRQLLCSFNHLEYEADTLSREYWRDRTAGKIVFPPRNLPLNAPPGSDAAWRESGQKLFANWAARIEPKRRQASLGALKASGFQTWTPRPGLQGLS